MDELPVSQRDQDSNFEIDVVWEPYAGLDLEKVQFALRELPNYELLDAGYQIETTSLVVPWRDVSPSLKELANHFGPLVLSCILPEPGPDGDLPQLHVVPVKRKDAEAADWVSVLMDLSGEGRLVAL